MCEVVAGETRSEDGYQWNSELEIEKSKQV